MILERLHRNVQECSAPACFNCGGKRRSGEEVKCNGVPLQNVFPHVDNGFLKTLQGTKEACT